MSALDEYALTVLRAIAAAGGSWHPRDVFNHGRKNLTGSARAYEAMARLVEREWATHAPALRDGSFIVRAEAWKLTEKGQRRVARVA